MTSPTEIPEALKAKAEELGSQVIYCLAEGATKIILAALLQVRNEAIAEEREACAAKADLWAKDFDEIMPAKAVTMRNIAAAIRARP